MASSVEINILEADKPNNTNENVSSPESKSPHSTSKEKKVASTPTSKSGSRKVNSGGSSPTKRDPVTSRTSPSKAYVSLAKKTSKASVHSKSPEDMYAELLEMKKALAVANEENVILKTKLRRVEEEVGKKSENDKVATNLLVNNMKRKIQQLEEALKEKETNLKKLQNEAKLAKQEAKVAMDSNKNTVKKSASVQKETVKTSKPPVSQNRIPSSRSADIASRRSNDQAVLDEIALLKDKLRRALSINKNIAENYDGLSNEDLLAHITKLKEEINSLKAVLSKLGAYDGGNAEVSASQIRETEMAEEIERLKLEVEQVKQDRLLYFEDTEKMEVEAKNLKEELEKARKELEGLKSGKTRPQSLVSKQSSLNNVPSNKATTVRRTPESSASKAAAGSKSKQVTSAKIVVNTSSEKGSASKAKPPTTLTVKSVLTTTTTSKSKVTKSKVSSPVVNGHSPVAVAAKNEDVKEACVIKEASKEVEVEAFRENVAAKKIQQGWRKHLTGEVKDGGFVTVEVLETNLQVMCEQPNDHCDEKLDEVATVIQSAVRGNLERTEQLNASFLVSEEASSPAREYEEDEQEADNVMGTVDEDCDSFAVYTNGDASVGDRNNLGGVQYYREVPTMNFEVAPMSLNDVLVDRSYGDGAEDYTTTIGVTADVKNDYDPVVNDYKDFISNISLSSGGIEQVEVYGDRHDTNFAADYECDVVKSSGFEGASGVSNDLVDISTCVDDRRAADDGNEAEKYSSNVDFTKDNGAEFRSSFVSVGRDDYYVEDNRRVDTTEDKEISKDVKENAATFYFHDVPMHTYHVNGSDDCSDYLLKD